MSATSTIPRALLKRRHAAEWMSISERTLSAIPADLLPIIRIGGSVRYRPSDIESLISQLASGEIKIGSVNG